MQTGVVLYTKQSARLGGYSKPLRELFGVVCTQSMARAYEEEVYQFELPGANASFFPHGVVKVRRPRSRKWLQLFIPHEVIAIHDLRGTCLELNIHFCLKCGSFTTGSISSEAIEVRAGPNLNRSIGLYKCPCGHQWKVVGR